MRHLRDRARHWHGRQALRTRYQAEVHHVNSVKVYSTRFAVSRHRREKQDPKF